MWNTQSIILCLTASFTALTSAATNQIPLNNKLSKKPNVVFILTDDQDIHLNSLDYMPFVQKHLIEKGTFFKQHYCTTAVCCPSRVTLWTGKAAHNTNVTDVNPPYGGYPKFISQGFNEAYLPVWLQAAGYNTYYTGKLFNVHSVQTYNKPYAAGFTGTEFLLDPYTYDYLNSTFQRNRSPPVSHEGEYSTDVLAGKAISLLDEAVESIDEKPFFLTIAPNAPHSNIVMKGEPTDPAHTVDFGAPISAERHKHLFKGVKVPRTENFNADEPSGANWLLNLPKQTPENVEYNDHFYRQRLRALQAVDEMVDTLFARLKHHNLLETTYIVYSSDNGFHIGQHRLQPGKSCGYEEDINIPLIVRGPGVGEGKERRDVTTHTDLAPTFFELLGIELREDFDGVAIDFKEQKEEGEENRNDERKEFVGVEYWGWAGSEGDYRYEPMLQNNTYKAIRLIGSGYNLYYSIWCNNEHELYNMDTDPGQLHNLLSPTSLPQDTILNLPISKLVSRLDTLLFVVKSCKGSVCYRPWETLHPEGDVLSLKDALDERFDGFYEEEQVRVRFQRCEDGYIVESEGPMFEREGVVFGSGKGLLWRDGGAWHEWT